MSDNIVIYKPKTHPDQIDDRVERIASTATIEPGSYWECTKGFDTDEQGDIRQRNQQYWMKQITMGDVCLLVDYAMDENKLIHNITLLLPPEHQTNSSSPKTATMLVDELYAHFSPCHEGEDVRKKQLDELMDSLSNTQNKITDINKDPRKLMLELEGATDNELVEARERLGSLKALPSPDAGTNLANVNQALDTKQQLEAKMEIAKTTGLVLKKINEELTSKAMVVGHYHSEVGHLAIARTKEARELVDRVTNAVASLDIYLGNDVDIVEVFRGETGNPDERFKLYQDMLYIDEESLINAKGGGADHHDVNQFFEMLGTDTKLRDRIFPFARCIVMIRPRREPVKYEGVSPFESAMLNQPNMLSFLMVRNGDNITAIYHPMGFLQKLFPSLSDLDEAFTRHGWGDCRNVTRNDITYTKSLDKVENIKRNYKRVVLMLQGVLERDEDNQIFGGFPGGAPMLLNPEDQARVFEFVSLENAVEDTRRPAYQEWFASLNKDIRVGSLVCTNSMNISPDNTPGAFSDNDGYGIQYWEIADDSFFEHLQVVEKHGDKIGFKRLFRHRYDNGEPRNFIIRLTESDIQRRRVIDLERVRSSDIEYYLNSRKFRADYANYIPQLMGLRDLAMAEEARTEQVRGAVSSVLRDAGKAVDDELVFIAVMKYRADQGGKFDLSCHNNAKALEAILNIYWQLTGGADKLIESIVAHFGDDKVALIVANTKNKLTVYTCDEDTAKGFDASGFPWFSKYQLENSKTMRFSKAKPARAADLRGKVTFVYRNDELYDDIKARQDAFHNLSFVQLKNLRAKFEAPGNEWPAVLTHIEQLLPEETITQEAFETLLEYTRRFNVDLKYRHNFPKVISLPILSFPVGYIVEEKVRERFYHPDQDQARLLRVNIELFDLLCEMFRRVASPDADWRKAMIREVYNITNEHHQRVFANTDSERKHFGIHFNLASMNESAVNVYSAFKDSPPHSGYLVDSNPENYLNYTAITQVKKLLLLDGMLSHYPSIAKAAYCKQRHSDDYSLYLSELPTKLES